MLKRPEGTRMHFSSGFEWDPEDVAFGEILEKAGHTPIPPYLKRKLNLGTNKLIRQFIP